ncbi:hypothetical protein [Curtobacterium sp. USHLN213]|uniref:hypothetical protein n=1 Tax=Curtobacterium sp. USHLN213 TaxID=3081255 RepID=UPI003018749B
MTLRSRIKELTGILNFLRDAGPEIEEHHSDSDAHGRDYKVSMGGAMAASFARVTGKSSARREISKKHSRSTTRTRRKEEFLRDLAPAIADVLELSANQEGAKSLIVVLDDFYFVPRATQPLVLDHLHGFTKKSNVWLKIGSVQSRTQTFADGDPPRGMQPPHDVQHLSLDVGLADFHTAKAFLEDVTANILRPIDLRLQDVLTEKGRERAVLIAGGAVSRDYFDLLIAAADQAWESAQREQKADGQFMIDTEDIQAAARVRLERKQKDLRNDAGRDASSLERRFEDVVKFVRDRDTFFFLVRQDHIDLDWGREIVELEDLRFVHRIMTTRPNTSAHRGVDTVVFMVDLPAIITRRARKAPVEFWKQGQGDKLRRAQWIYDPGWTTTPAKNSKSPSSNTDIAEEKPREPTLFDD